MSCIDLPILCGLASIFHPAPVPVAVVPTPHAYIAPAPLAPVVAPPIAFRRPPGCYNPSTYNYGYPSYPHCYPPVHPRYFVDPIHQYGPNGP